MYSAFFAGMITCELDLLTASGEINRLWLPWRGITDYLKTRERARSIFLHSGLFFGLLFASTPLLHTDKPVKEAIANCSSWPSVLFNIVPWQYWNNWPDIAYRDFWSVLLGSVFACWNCLLMLYRWFWGAWLSAASIKEIRWARKLFETSFAQCKWPSHHPLRLPVKTNIITPRPRPPLLLTLPHAPRRRSDLLPHRPHPHRFRPPRRARRELTLRSNPHRCVASGFPTSCRSSWVPTWHVAGSDPQSACHVLGSRNGHQDFRPAERKDECVDVGEVQEAAVAVAADLYCSYVLQMNNSFLSTSVFPSIQSICILLYRSSIMNAEQ